MTIRFTPLPTATVRALQSGGPDAYGQPPERHVSDGGGNPCRHCLRMIPAGAPMLVLSSLATLFGAFDQVTTTSLLLALPIATWEFSLGVYLTVKGFRAQPQPAVDRTRDGHDVPQLAGAIA